MKIKILPIFLFAFCGLLAQKHDQIWLAGYSTWPHTRIDFSTIPPTISTYTSGIYLGSNVVFFADSSGSDLLFYTDGLRIYNRNHEIMEGGDTINFGRYWDPSFGEVFTVGKNSFAIPDPSTDSTYLLLHMRLGATSILQDFLNDRIAYSRIDMHAQYGLGRVVEADVALTTGNFTHPVVVKHGNGRDWWLICPERNSRNVWRYLIAKDGITGPFIQITTFQFPSDEFISPLIVTPDGQTLVRSVDKQGFILYSFDRCTGLLSNTRVIHHPHTGYIYDMSISSDNRFLYFSDPYHLMSMDLKAEFLIPATLDTIAMFDGFRHPPVFGAQFYQHTLGADGKIYFSTGNSTKFMHVIHSPRLPWQACDFEQRGLALIDYSARTVPAYINYRLPPLGNECPVFKPEEQITPDSHTDQGYRVLNPEVRLLPDKNQENKHESFYYLLPDGTHKKYH